MVTTGTNLLWRQVWSGGIAAIFLLLFSWAPQHPTFSFLLLSWG